MSLDVALYIEVDTGGDRLHKVDLFDYNITHNLGRMAVAAGLYDALWCPNENGCAGDILPSLVNGYNELKGNPCKYKGFNPGNGWGCYEGLLSFVEAYMVACDSHPLAHIWISK